MRRAERRRTRGEEREQSRANCRSGSARQICAANRCERINESKPTTAIRAAAAALFVATKSGRRRHSRKRAALRVLWVRSLQFFPAHARRRILLELAGTPLKRIKARKLPALILRQQRDMRRSRQQIVHLPTGGLLRDPQRRIDAAQVDRPREAAH